MTAYFDPQHDQISFRPHKWSRLPKDHPPLSRQEDEYGDVLYRFDVDAPDAPRILTLVASSMLASAPRTEFEELVLAQWDQNSGIHTKATQEYELAAYDDTRFREDLTRLVADDGDNRELVHSVCRSYERDHA